MLSTKTGFRTALVSVLPFVLATCGGESPIVTGPTGNGSDNTVASIAVSPGTASLEVGNTTQFQAQARNASGSLLSGVSFSWSSSNSNVASVNSSGLATAQGVGTTSIRATASGITGTASLDVTQRTPQFSGFDFQLSQGDYWDFYWSYEYNSVSGPESPPPSDTPGNAPQANTHSVTGGHFRITLGAAISLQGVGLFELIMSGDYNDGDWDYTPRWQYIGLSEHQIVGSQDGQSLEVIFDAMNGEWAGGGFWAEYTTETQVTASASTLENEFINTAALSVRRSAGQDFCETIAGHTICPNDQAWSFSESEYYRGGIGPVGLYSYSGYSFSGGGFFDSFSHLRHVGLVASSLAGANGIVPPAPPWIEKSPMPTARANHAAAVADGKVYVFGGELRTEAGTTILGTVDVYDPTNDTWATAASMPAPRSGHSATEHGGNIYVIGGQGSVGGAQTNVWEYDPSLNAWNVRNPAATSLTEHSAASQGQYILLYPGSSNNAYAYEVAPDDWWAITSSPARYAGHASVAVGTSVFVIGGSYRDWGIAGYFTNYTGATLEFDATENYGSENAWTYRAWMPTRRASLALAAVSGNVFAIGGYNADGPARTVEMYDPVADTWGERFPLMSGIKEHVVAVVDGKVYVIGGSGYWDSVTSVYEYDPANDW